MKSSEKLDPYFEERLERAKQHRVIARLDIESSQQEVEPNLELPNPTIDGTIEEFSWSEKAVDNLIDAATKGYIKIEKIDENEICIEFLPVKELPEKLGHVCEKKIVHQNITSKSLIFGQPSNEAFTYLQTVDFAVEGYIDDETHGKEYARLFVDTTKLKQYRNVYLDPESLNVTDYEYGFSFCVYGGVPFKAIEYVEIIQAKQMPYKPFSEIDEAEYDAEREMERQASRLRDFIDSRKTS